MESGGDARLDCILVSRPEVLTSSATLDDVQCRDCHLLLVHQHRQALTYKFSHIHVWIHI